LMHIRVRQVCGCAAGWSHDSLGTGKDAPRYWERCTVDRLTKGSDNPLALGVCRVAATSRVNAPMRPIPFGGPSHRLSLPRSECAHLRDACGLRAGAYTFGGGAAAIGARWEVLPKTAASYGGARGQREAAPRCVAVLSERATE
jgi:hypothetical protein